jgi:SAM-dependent methyltransferase
VLAAADPRPGDQVVNLGCGTGQLSLPLAGRRACVLAVDVSPAMIARLEVNAHDRSLAGAEGIALPIEHLSLAVSTTLGRTSPLVCISSASECGICEARLAVRSSRSTVGEAALYGAHSVRRAGAGWSGVGTPPSTSRGPVIGNPAEI